LNQFAYMFEAKGIQRYIFASGKLRDVVGASDLVAGLANSDDDPDEIRKLLLGLNCTSPVFSRRAGGAFCLHSDDRGWLRTVRAHWRLWVMSHMPGLEFSETFGEGADEIKAMHDCFENAGGIRHNMAAEVMPYGRPISRIAPLTGRPAVAKRDYSGDEVLLDAITKSQRDWADNHEQVMGSIARRFVSDPATCTFPRDFDPDRETKIGAKNPLFPFRGDGKDRRIAIVHADLSGLGELFRTMGTTFGTAKENFDLAKAIEDAISGAAKAASALLQVDGLAVVDNKRIMPARPVLLGGDDITIIVRADLALAFTEALLIEIETLCENTVAAKITGALSACAGVAIVRPGTPFLTASHLAESLCNHAKKAVKAKGKIDHGGRMGYASALSFYLQHQTALESADDVYKASVGAGGVSLHANPYGLGVRAENLGRPTFETLAKLAEALAGIEGGHSALREIKMLFCENKAQAEARWQRWWEHGNRRQPREMDGLKALLAGGVSFPTDDQVGILFDALILIDLFAVTRPELAAAA
jgi:hypothetical protein